MEMVRAQSALGDALRQREWFLTRIDRERESSLNNEKSQFDIDLRASEARVADCEQTIEKLKTRLKELNGEDK
jgi:primosomal protein N''